MNKKLLTLALLSISAVALADPDSAMMPGATTSMANSSTTTATTTATTTTASTVTTMTPMMKAAPTTGVTVFGQVAAGVEWDAFPSGKNTSSSSGSPYPSLFSLQDYGSELGIKGYHPIGNSSLAFIWQIEQYLDISTGQTYYNSKAGNLIVPSSYQDATTLGANAANGFQGRISSEVNTFASAESYVGITSDSFGTIRLGNLKSYIKSDVANADIFNSGNGVDDFGVYDRTQVLLPTSVRYDTPDLLGHTDGHYGHLNAGIMYDFNTIGTGIVNGFNTQTNFALGNNGDYSDGVISGGLTYQGGDNSWDNHMYASWGILFSPKVGYYYGSNSRVAFPSAPTNLGHHAAYDESTSAYKNAYATRLELGYNDPTSLDVNLGMQITSGLGWNSWFNSGGSMDNLVYNNSVDQSTVQALKHAEYQTEEYAVSLAYHFVSPSNADSVITPKIGFVHGADIKTCQNFGHLLFQPDSNGIDGTGYNQFVAEVEWAINKQATMFVNYGYFRPGETLQNIKYVTPGTYTATGTDTMPANSVTSASAFMSPQHTVAFGMIYKF